MTRPLTFGVRVTTEYDKARGRRQLQEQRAIWQILDADGAADGIWVMDHMGHWREDEPYPVFDGWTVLTMIAAVTRRARLGVEITGLPYRYPSVLAKTVTTLDHYTDGRIIVGLGAGSGESEYRQLGLPYGPPPERIRALDEACTVMKALWTDPVATVDGQYYRLNHAYHDPKPLQKPHPPIWIGGYGAKGTLRVAAKHAAVWNCSGGRGWEITMEAMRNLDEHCRQIGRDPASIGRSVQGSWGPATATASIDEIRRYVGAGFTDFVIDLDDDTPTTAEAFVRDGLPRLRELTA